MRAIVALLLGVLLASSSLAQQGVTYPPGSAVDLTQYAKTADIMAAMPQPAISVPVADSQVAAVGSQATRYMLPDSVRPARYRSGSCAIGGGTGQCVITWSIAFSSAPNPLGDPSAINTSPGTLQFNCNWVAVTTSNGTVQCRTSILGLAILGTIWSLLGNDVTVYGTAVYPL